MYEASRHRELMRVLANLKKQIGKSKKEESYFEQFKIRLSANYHSMVSLLGELYSNDHDVHKLAEEVIKVCFLNYSRRSEELKKIDLQREEEKNWLQSEKWVGMMLYLDLFSDDLKGLIKKLSYLEELGVNWVHIMPLLKSPEGENDGGYAVSDFRQVQARFGSVEDLEKLAQEFRKKGMLMTIDFVMNHTSDEHQWAGKAKTGDPKYQAYYFMFNSRAVPDQFELSMPEVFPESAPGNFTFDDQSGKWVMTQFHEYQWDLNYYNPSVLIEMLDTAFYLANLGVDILRLDAVPFLWKKLGTQCRNEYEAHVILRVFKACFEVTMPGVAFIAEAIVRPHEIMGYFGQGDYQAKECDIAYNATLMALCWEALATGETTLLRKVIGKMPAKPAGTTWINYLRSHDDIGLGFDDEDLYELGIDARNHRKFLIDYYSGNYHASWSSGAPFAQNDKTGDARISGTLSALTGLDRAIEAGDKHLIRTSLDRIRMLQTVILSYGGLPMLYSGNEIGLANDTEYVKDPEKSADNRWMHRPKMDWTKAERRAISGAVEAELFGSLKRLIELRKGTPEFADLNNFSLEYCENKHILAYLRWYDHHRVLVLVNFFNGTQFARQDIMRKIGMDMQSSTDILTGDKPKYFHDLIEFKPYQTYWIREIV